MSVSVSAGVFRHSVMATETRSTSSDYMAYFSIIPSQRIMLASNSGSLNACSGFGKPRLTGTRPCSKQPGKDTLRDPSGLRKIWTGVM